MKAASRTTSSEDSLTDDMGQHSHIATGQRQGN